MMKKLFFALFAISAMVACSDDGIDQITIDTTSVNFATVGGSTSVTFASSGAWTAEVVNGGANAWCSVSPASGKAGNAEICITATANDTTDDRTATVVIKTGTIEKSIAVSQKQKDALDVSTSTFEFSAEGGEFKIEVGHNVEFDIEIDGDWITQMQPRALETSTLTFAVAENTTGQSREGSVTLTSKDDALSQVISVRQEAPRYEIVYTSSDGKVVIPGNKSAFGANIVSNVYENGRGVITFDGPITSIGDSAFYDCSSLKSVTIPQSVTSIGTSSFYNCTSLMSIIIPESVTSFGGYAFYGCESMTSIKIPNNVAYIGGYAFDYCESLTSINIPDSLSSIGVGTFGHCASLINITIPNSITSLGDYAFIGCSSLSAFYGKFASVDNRCLIVDGELKAFAPAGLTAYSITDDVTSIGEFVFGSCSSLTSITIPDSVTLIGGNAFYACSALASVNMSDGTISIGEYAFSNCTSLTSITIPDSVTSIGESAFFYCPVLIYVYCRPSTPPELESYVFDSNASGRKIYVPTASVTAYKNAANWSEYVDYIEGYNF